jgi:hypothetical protein
MAAVFAVALALRLLWIANTDTAVPPLSDPQYYHATASNLADGQGYSVAVDARGFVGGEQGEATAFWPPGYSFALAPLYEIFGNEERVAKAFNAVGGALTVIPTYFIGLQLTVSTRRTVGWEERHAAGLIAATLVALLPAMIFWTPVLFSDGLLAFGVATTFALAIWARQHEIECDSPGRPSHIGSCAVVGVALAATAMVKSQAVVLAPPVALLLVRRLELWALARALAPAIVAGAAIIVPWTVRNQIAMGQAYVINDNLCYNLRASHAPYSTGGSVPPQDLWDERPGLTFRERELFFDDAGCGRAWAYAREHPARELELAPKKIGWLLRSDAADAVSWSKSLGRTPIHRGAADAFVLLGDVIWYPMIALALSSPLALARTRETLAVWLALVVWAALHVVFHGEPRYHVAVAPLVAALAAGAGAAAVVKPAGWIRRL